MDCNAGSVHPLARKDCEARMFSQPEVCKGLHEFAIRFIASQQGIFC